jgi:hypothetical protein
MTRRRSHGVGLTTEHVPVASVSEQRALTLAWTQDGGQVIGLAPSAAAAAVLGEQTGIRADTLAKRTPFGQLVRPLTNPALIDQGSATRRPPLRLSSLRCGPLRVGADPSSLTP